MRSILQYFRPSLSHHLSLRSLFCLFLSSNFTQVNSNLTFNWEEQQKFYRISNLTRIAQACFSCVIQMIFMLIKILQSEKSFNFSQNKPSWMLPMIKYKWESTLTQWNQNPSHIQYHNTFSITPYACIPTPMQHYSWQMKQFVNYLSYLCRKMYIVSHGTTLELPNLCEAIPVRYHEILWNAAEI